MSQIPRGSVQAFLDGRLQNEVGTIVDHRGDGWESAGLVE